MLETPSNLKTLEEINLNKSRSFVICVFGALIYFFSLLLVLLTQVIKAFKVIISSDKNISFEVIDIGVRQSV